MLQIFTFTLVLAMFVWQFFAPDYAVVCTPATPDQVASAERFNDEISTASGKPVVALPSCVQVKL